MTIPQEVVQYCFPFFDSDAEIVEHQAQLNKIMRRASARRGGVATAIVIEVVALIAPIAQSIVEVPDVSRLPEDPAEEALVLANLADKDRCTQAFMQNFDRFVAHHLDLNMAVLASRGNIKEKLDILDWIFAPDYMGALDLTEAAASGRGKDMLDVLRWSFPQGYQARRDEGRHLVVPVYAIDIPFSFAWCCRVVSTDPDRWRDAIENELRALARKGKAAFVTAADHIGALH